MAYVLFAPRLLLNSFDPSYRLRYYLSCRLGRPVTRRRLHQSTRTLRNARSTDLAGENIYGSQRREGNRLRTHVALRNAKREAGDTEPQPDKIELRNLKKKKRVYEDSLKLFYNDLLGLARKIDRALPRARLVARALQFAQDEFWRTPTRLIPRVMFHAVDLTEGKPEWVELLCANIIKNQRELFLHFVQVKYPALNDWIIEHKREMRNGKIRIPSLPRNQNPWNASVPLKLKLNQEEKREPAEQANPKRVNYLDDPVLWPVVQHETQSYKLKEFDSAITVAPDLRESYAEQNIQHSGHIKKSSKGIKSVSQVAAVPSDLPRPTSSEEFDDHARSDPSPPHSSIEAAFSETLVASPSDLSHAQALTAANDFFLKHFACQLWVGTQWRSRPFHSAFGIVSEVALLSHSCLGKNALLNAIFGAQRSPPNIRKEMIKTMRARSIRAASDAADGLGRSNDDEEKPAVPEMQGGDRSVKLGILNMPAYGYAGQGATPYEIVEYLSIRTGVKAAFVLIDASQDAESCDLQILELLKQYGIFARPVILGADQSHKATSRMDPTTGEKMENLEKIMTDYAPITNVTKTEDNTLGDGKPGALFISPATGEWDSLEQGDATGIDEMRLAILDATGVLSKPKLGENNQTAQPADSQIEVEEPIIDFPSIEPPPKPPRPFNPEIRNPKRKKKPAKKPKAPAPPPIEEQEEEDSEEEDHVDGSSIAATDRAPTRPVFPQYRNPEKTRKREEKKRRAEEEAARLTKLEAGV
ncbi:MAG: hypothetical protein Q9160_004791 [Pyrenula sp. 1 TL-2023]